MTRQAIFFVLSSMIAAAVAEAGQPPMVYEGTIGGVRQLEQGQPPAVVHPTLDEFVRGKSNSSKPRSGGSSTNLSYHGGLGGVGVEASPKVFLVLWGSQWNNNDPSGEAPLLEAFLGAMGGSSWLNTVTQYCEGVASGTVTCGTSGTKAGNQTGMLVSYWYDNSTAAPSAPTQSQIAAEAARAAAYFGNTTSASNANVQYVIATAHGNNSSGFGTQYCAYHSYTGTSFGNVAYTNLPYITDAGASCGANFNGLGPNAGVTIVEGHEAAETITDQFPNYGWLDGNGYEIGDKCAWISSGQGASANVVFPSGSSFPVQSLWSNAFNSGAGGCVISY